LGIKPKIEIKRLEFSLLMAGLVLVAFFLGLTTGQESIFYDGDAAKNLGSSTNYIAENQPPALISLQPDKKGPTRAGTTINWSAKASDPDSDALLFQFWLNGPSTGNAWKAVTNWTVESTWNWITTSQDMGNNIIEVRVRDGQHASPDEWDGKLNAEHLVVAKDNQKPNVLSLKPDKVSPQSQGSIIVWTATASDPNGDTLLYKWWLKGPSTDEVLTSMTDWTTKSQWTWYSSSSVTGLYSIEVWVRDGYHAGPEEDDDLQRESFVIKQFVP
jgi:hypothetical protein